MKTEFAFSKALSTSFMPRGWVAKFKMQETTSSQTPSFSGPEKVGSRWSRISKVS